MQFIKWIGKHESQPWPVLDALLDSLRKVDEKHVGAILTILAGACWRRLDDAVSLDDQQRLITTLAHLTPETLHKLDALYQLTPCPGIQALLEQSTKSEDEIAAWIAAYELDPFGHRHMMMEQYTLKGVDEFLAGMQPLTEEQILPDALKDTLKENIQYILACSHHACLPISGTIKPINQFTAQELQSYYQDCMAKSHSNFEDSTSRLEALAILCEVYFRTTGRFPYYSQILSVMSTFYLDGHTLLEIPTGQGKSITKALLAAWQFSFGRAEGAAHVMALAPNALLTKRDFDESRAFFDYLHLPTALVTATTVDNHFETPTIIYSTAADASLYCSKLKMVDKAHFPLADARFLIVDEVDAELYDNSTAFNFSDSQEDIYTNPLAWVYPLANQFIDSPIFLNEAFTEQEDVLLFKQYLQEKDTNAYQQHETRLSAFKLNQLLDAACIAKQLQENRDFLVRRVTRMVYGKEQIISQAHVLINHVEDKEATLSYGVQQALHARLNQQHEEDIDLFKRTNGEQGMPPFPCDNQIECIDSQNVASFFSQFGHQVGITGTAGTAQELTFAMTHFGFQHLLKIPPRRPGKLHYLPTVFCNPKAAFFFRASTQIEALQRLAMKHKHQPLLIACKDIDKTEQLYGGLVQSVGSDRIQMIHAKNCDDTEEFERRIAQAKQAGMITLVTPLVGRGVDIKTQRANVNPPKSQQQHLDKLAETLLVVETDLFRYRDRAQLKGRTARDGKAGEFIGIFNLNDLVAQANRDTRPRSRHAKLALLDLITATMDAEATVEHGIRHQVKEMQVSWANQFDAYLQQALDTEQQRAIVAAKAHFLLESDRLWTQLLEDANPNGQRLNPYICYTNHTLDSEHLNATLVQYRTQLTPLYQALIEPLNLPLLLPNHATPVVAQPKRLALIDKPKNQTMIPTFIAREEQKPVENETQALYRAALAANETVQKELAPWLAKYPQARPLFSQAQVARDQAIKDQNSVIAANLMGLGVGMAQGNLTQLTMLMDSHALALQALTAVEAPTDVLPALLKTLNAAVLSPAIPHADKEAFVRLHEELQTHNDSSLTAVLIELPVL
ncbi:MAG TPA: hypothetical protein DCW74_14730, partial [Alteromonas australica]|nr:hypothetical protein [Alteromonas australica]